MMMASLPLSAGTSNPPLTAVTFTVPYGSSLATAAVSTPLGSGTATVTSTNMSLAVLPSIRKKPRLEWRVGAGGVGEGAPGGLGALAPVNVAPHAHFGDTAHACHGISSCRCDRTISIGEGLLSQSSLAAAPSSHGAAKQRRDARMHATREDTAFPTYSF